MSEAVQRAEQASAANKYPGNEVPLGLRAQARLSWRQREGEIREQFGKDLADEYAADLPEAVQDKIFQRAWVSGHSSGYPQVAQDYEELAEFARFARDA